MGIHVEWVDEEKEILHFKYVGKWDWDEFHENMFLANQMKDSVDHTVHHIYDMTESAKLPKGAFKQLYGLRKWSHERLGRLVLVTEDRFYNAFSRMMRRMYPGVGKNFGIVPTLADAIRELKGTVDSTN